MRIAVSYRNQDAGFGGRLTGDLERRLTRDAVMRAGDAAAFDVLVAILARESFVPAAEVEPDRVRRALERALRTRTPIVLVTPAEAMAPTAAELPPQLADLEPIRLSDEYWDATVNRVVERIERLNLERGHGRWRRTADQLLRQSRRVKIGAAVSVVGGVVGILAALGVLSPDPRQRGEVQVTGTSRDSVTYTSFLATSDHAADTPSNPVSDVQEGYAYDVDLTLDDPQSDRYALRWTLRVHDDGMPIERRRDLVGLRFSAKQATGAHEVWVPCPPERYDAVPYDVVFALVDASQPDVPPLDRAQATGPPPVCQFVEG